MLRPRSLSWFFLVSLLALPGLAGENRWTIHGPYGGTINAVEFDALDPSIVYVGTDNGLFRSVDGGQHWLAATELAYHVVYDVAAAKDDPAKVFAATWGGIYQSDDRGVTWRRMEDSRFSTQIAVSSDGRTVYGYDSDRTLTRFSNGGATYSFAFANGLPPNGYVDSIAIDPENSQVLYASLIYEGVYKSVDGGAHFTAANAGLASPLYRTVIVDPSNRNTLYVATATSIYKSTNGAASWSALPIGPATRCWSIDISDRAPSTLVAGTDRGVLRSTNGGTTWTSPRLSDVKAVAIDPLNPARVLAAAGLHLFRSTDGGVNYTLAESGVISQPTAVIALDPWDPATVYAAGAGGVHKSTDRGVTWSALGSMSSAPVRLPPSPPPIAALAVDGLDSSILYAIWEGVVFRSVNGGETWQRFTDGLSGAFAASLAVDPRTSGTLYAVANGTVYRKTADGAWAARRTGLPPSFWASFIIIDPQDSAVLYLGDTDGLFKSTNAGESWTALEYPTRYYTTGLAIDPFDPNHLFLASTRMRESKDRGTTWSDFTQLEGESTIVFDPSTPGCMYARRGSIVSASRLSQSNDGGRTWSTLPNPGNIVDARVLAIAPDGHTLYAGGTRAGVWTYHFPFEPVGRRRAVRH